MVRLREINQDSELHAPRIVVLDAVSFYEKSLIRGELYVPPVLLKILDKLSMEFDIVALFSPEEVKHPLIERIRDALKSVLGIAGEGRIKYPPIGRVVELRYEEWGKLLHQYGSPLFYNGENPSDPRVLQYVRASERFRFPTSHQFMLRMLNNYWLGKAVRPSENALKSPDVRKAHQAQEFSRGSRNRFIDKFNI